jgi:hypothetical protein
LAVAVPIGGASSIVTVSRSLSGSVSFASTAMLLSAAPSARTTSFVAVGARFGGGAGGGVGCVGGGDPPPPAPFPPPPPPPPQLDTKSATSTTAAAPRDLFSACMAVTASKLRASTANALLSTDTRQRANPGNDCCSIRLRFSNRTVARP